MKAILKDIDNEEISKEILRLWMEYEEGTSIEADLARQLDKFEMIVQANEYELANPGKILQTFFNSTNDSFSHPEVSLLSLQYLASSDGRSLLQIVGWASTLRNQRDQRLSNASIDS
jgi:5'-deoxynucleotidase YfbR-like HD superfamily hydrolase